MSRHRARESAEPEGHELVARGNTLAGGAEAIDEAIIVVDGWRRPTEFAVRFTELTAQRFAPGLTAVPVDAPYPPCIPRDRGLVRRASASQTGDAIWAYLVEFAAKSAAGGRVRLI